MLMCNQNIVMKQFLKYTKSVLVLTTMAMTMLLPVACSDDIADEDIYTAKKSRLSDWLQENPEFSEFAAIVEKAGRMPLFSTYGTYTCFAPTNEAVRNYYAATGLSLDKLSREDCDTIVCTSVIDQRYFFLDFKEMLEQVSNEASSDDKTTFLATPNLLGRYLSIEPILVPVREEEADSELKSDSDYVYRINRSGVTIYALRNDSVLNGVVHPVDAMITASSLTLPMLLDEDPNITIFNLALQMTGLDKQMHRIKDSSYDPYYWRDDRKMEGLYSTGAQQDYCHVPQERRFGFTAFCVPDSVLREQYGITTWEGLYDYACKIYPDGVDEDYYGKEPEALKDERNPLHKLIAYHLLNRKLTPAYITTDCTVLHTLVNSTEWYSTMSPLSTMKIEKVAASFNKFRGDAKPNTLYINRMYDPQRPSLKARGAIVSTSLPSGLIQEGVNGIYYYIDRLVDYGQETQAVVFNTRMRVDLFTIFPEPINNNQRAAPLHTWGNLPTEDPDADAKNYIYPPGYLDNVDMNEDGDFFLQGCRNYFWSYEGDEFNLRSDNDSYDITFNLPSVPSGQYQIRLGFTAMARRGIAQFYIDGIPQGIPLDMRQTNEDIFKQRIGGWKEIPDGVLSAQKKEELDQVKKDMHNLGWYHGPRSFRFVSQGALKNDLDLKESSSGSAARTAIIVRRVIYEGYLDGNKQHTMRIRSVMAIGGAELMIDYLEFVPKSVYGVDNEEAAEDDL